MEVTETGMLMVGCVCRNGLKISRAKTEFLKFGFGSVVETSENKGEERLGGQI